VGGGADADAGGGGTVNTVPAAPCVQLQAEVEVLVAPKPRARATASAAVPSAMVAPPAAAPIHVHVRRAVPLTWLSALAPTAASSTSALAVGGLGVVVWVAPNDTALAAAAAAAAAPSTLALLSPDHDDDDKKDGEAGVEADGARWTAAAWVQRPPARSVLARLVCSVHVPLGHVAVGRAARAACGLAPLARVHVRLLPGLPTAVPPPRLQWVVAGDAAAARAHVAAALRHAHAALPAATLVPFTDGLVCRVAAGGRVGTLRLRWPDDAQADAPRLCAVAAAHVADLAVEVLPAGPSAVPLPHLSGPGHDDHDDENDDDDNEEERGWAVAAGARFGGVDAWLATLLGHLRACVAAPALWQYAHTRRPMLCSCCRGCCSCCCCCGAHMRRLSHHAGQWQGDGDAGASPCAGDGRAWGGQDESRPARDFRPPPRPGRPRVRAICCAQGERLRC
jgi:hypothetical protein